MFLKRENETAWCWHEFMHKNTTHVQRYFGKNLGTITTRQNMTDKCLEVYWYSLHTVLDRNATQTISQQHQCRSWLKLPDMKMPDQIAGREIGPSLSRPAISCPASWSVNFMSCNFFHALQFWWSVIFSAPPLQCSRLWQFTSCWSQYGSPAQWTEWPLYRRHHLPTPAGQPLAEFVQIRWLLPWKRLTSRSPQFFHQLLHRKTRQLVTGREMTLDQQCHSCLDEWWQKLQSSSPRRIPMFTHITITRL